MAFPKPQRVQVYNMIRDQIAASKSFTGLTGCVIGPNHSEMKEPFAAIYRQRADKVTYDMNQTSIDFLPFTIRVYGSEEDVERALAYLRNLWLDKFNGPFKSLSLLGVINMRYIGTTPTWDAKSKDESMNYGENKMQVVIESSYLLAS